MKRDFTELTDYVRTALACVARQLAETGGKLPPYLVIPAPANPLQHEQIVRVISQYVQERPDHPPEGIEIRALPKFGG